MQGNWASTGSDTVISQLVRKYQQTNDVKYMNRPGQPRKTRRQGVITTCSMLPLFQQHDLER